MELISPKEANWLETSLEALDYVGCAIITDVLAPAFCDEVKKRMYKVNDAIIEEVGISRLREAKELGVLRLPMLYDPIFFKFLEIPELLSIIEHTVSSTCILHLQNAFILPPTPKKDVIVFQNTFHQDFPRVFNGYKASINVFFALDEFTNENGSTRVLPGTHQNKKKPSEEYSKKFSESITCPAGSMIVFDSTLWHAAGINISSKDRLAINHQFTRSFFKQQIDYVKALGEPIIKDLPPRSQQLLGYYTRVVSSLDEYYRPEAERLYRKGQG